MPAGSYSFDLITNKLHYELQYDLQPGDTHDTLQHRLMRLINNSDLGVHAEVLQDDNGRSALQLPLMLMVFLQKAMNISALRMTILPTKTAWYITLVLTKTLSLQKCRLYNRW